MIDEYEYLGELTYDEPSGHRAEPVHGCCVEDVQRRIDAARERGARHVRWSRHDDADCLVDSEDLRDLGE